ncbi:MAG: hypothetical protein WB723_19315, partial [Candidatus Acidiferrales bacterium]
RSDLCIWALEQLIKRIGERGPDPEDLELLRIVYGDQPTEHAALTMHMLADAKAVQTQKDEAAVTTLPKLRESILKMLQAEIEAQTKGMELANDLIAIEGAADLREPTGNTLETLQRYRTANMREFTHLMHSLERIRRLRDNAA